MSARVGEFVQFSRYYRCNKQLITAIVVYSCTYSVGTCMPVSFVWTTLLALYLLHTTTRQILLCPQYILANIFIYFFLSLCHRLYKQPIWRSEQTRSYRDPGESLHCDTNMENDICRDELQPVIDDDRGGNTMFLTLSLPYYTNLLLLRVLILYNMIFFFLTFMFYKKILSFFCPPFQPTQLINNTNLYVYFIIGLLHYVCFICNYCYDYIIVQTPFFLFFCMTIKAIQWDSRYDQNQNSILVFLFCFFDTGIIILHITKMIKIISLKCRCTELLMFYGSFLWFFFLSKKMFIYAYVGVARSLYRQVRWLWTRF